MSAGAWVLAVDLGTTRTRAAYLAPDGTEPEFVEVPPNQVRWLPSSVARDPSGTWLTGHDAEPLRIGWDNMYFRNAKRLLGQPQPHYLGGHPFSVLELFAQPLIYVATLARAQAEHGFDRLELAAPVEFEGVRRDLLVQAGEMAGFPPPRISVISEPEAAARAALGPNPPDGNWLLFDMGGGTLDVALFRTIAGSLELIDTDGTDQVSGDVIDSAIIEHLRTAYPIPAAAPEPTKKRSHQEADQPPDTDLRDATEDARRRRETQLRDTAEQLKRAVTARRDGRAYVQDPPVRVTLSPESLRKLIEPVIEPAMEQCGVMLREHEMGWDDLSAVICAGGSTRSAVIRQLLAARAPVRDAAVNPEEAVVRGLLVPRSAEVR